MKIVSIGGHCADLIFLDQNIRVPGPVDNWYAIHGMESIVGLFSDFEEQLARGWSNKEKKPIWYDGDSSYKYDYADYSCLHLNIENPVIMEKVRARYATFLKFWDMVKSEPDCYFSYVLNPVDVRWRNRKNVLSKSTMNVLKEIDDFFPLNKLIVVGTQCMKTRDVWFKYYVDEIPAGVNYVNINDVNYKNKESAQEQFNKYIEENFGAKV